MAARRQARTDIVEQLGGKRAGPHARGVRLGDAQDVIEVARSETAAHRRTPRGGVGGGHERVRAQIDVEQCALSALEQNVGASFAQPVQDGDNVRNHRPQLLGSGRALVESGLIIDRIGLEIVGEHEVVVIHDFRQPRREVVPVEKITQPDAAPRHLVLVCGADAAPRGADLLAAARGLAREVKPGVVRQDEGAGGADAQPLANRHAAGLQAVDFLQQGMRLEHHPVADQALHAGTEDAGRDQMQHGLGAADDQGVAGVMSALETHNRRSLLGEEIDDLAFAFVTPLGADHDDVASHQNMLVVV